MSEVTGNINKEELFLLDRKDGGKFIYAPLRPFAAILNNSGAASIAKFYCGQFDKLNPADRKIIDALKAEGLFTKPYPQPPRFPENYEFCPHEATLFLTSRCNLRCRYCYADAGKKSIDMPWNIAKAAIDLTARNAGRLGADQFAVGFHGGGEPTMAWEMLKRCVTYTRQKADEKGLDADIYAATNGLFTPKQQKFIVENFNTLNVSLDGPPEVHDAQRVRVDGSGSYEQIAKSLKFFDEVGFPYGIRATVVESTVHKIPEIAKFLLNEFKPMFLHIEPVWQCGRCMTTGEVPPSDDSFIKQFLIAEQIADQAGHELVYSGARLNVLTNKFCAAPGDSFTVLPEGIVTSCFEITEADDPNAAIFHYGNFNAQTNEFDFDLERLKHLRSLSVENLAYCSDCFCKWHCAGDCLSKVFKASGSARHEGSSRCKLNRELTLAQLERLTCPGSNEVDKGVVL